RPHPTDTYTLSLHDALPICYGHTDSAGDPKYVVTFNKTFTKAEGEEILRRDLGQYESAVSNAVKVPLNDNQFSALVSFTYNLGADRKSTRLNSSHVKISYAV